MQNDNTIQLVLPLSGRFPVILLFCGAILLAACTPSPQPGSEGSLGKEAAQALRLALRARELGQTPRYDKLVLSFTGDLMAHAPTFNMENYDEIYAGLGDLLLQDHLSFSNLETVADQDKPYSSYPRFNVKRPFVEAAVRAGIDVFSLANNHTNDHGLESSFKTRETLDAIQEELLSMTDRRLWYSGIRQGEDEDLQVTEIEFQGWKIGFISITHFVNDYRASQAVYLVPFWEKDSEAKFIELVQKEAPKYHLFIVSYHGGEEYLLQPPGHVRAFVERIYEAGAQIVWGNHPHVLQPWEPRYEYPARNSKGLLMYSLGNFISGQTWALTPKDASNPRAYTGDSVILQVTVHRDRQTGEVFLAYPREHWIGTRVQDRKTLIRLQEDLTRDEDEDWAAFYQMRALAMRELKALVPLPPLWTVEARPSALGLSR